MHLTLVNTRGLLAIIVLLAHSNQIFIAPYNNKFSNILGILASWSVLSFFVISGYSIRNSIENNIRENNYFVLRKYISSRINRLYPPLIFSFIISLLLWIISPFFFASKSHTFLPTVGRLARSEYDFHFFDLLGSLFFLNGFFTNNFTLNGPLWTLSFEFWYYIVAAVFFTQNNLSKAVSKIFAVLIFLLFTYQNKVFGLYGIVWFLSFFHIEISIFPYLFKLKFFKYLYLFSAVLLAYVSLYPIDNIIFSLSKTAELSFLFSSVFFGLYSLHQLIFLKIPISSTKDCSYLSFSFTLYIIHFPILLFIFGAFQNLTNKSLGMLSLQAIFSSFFIIWLSWLFGRYVENIKIISK